MTTLSGVKLIDEEYQKDAHQFDDMLHDGFFETYWEWRKVRGDKKWKLDTHDE